MIRFVLLFLLATVASAQTFQVQPSPVPITVACGSGSATQNGNTFTCAGSVPQCPSPPGSGPCDNPPPGSVYVGELQFTGVQVDTPHVGPNTPCVYAKIVIPQGAVGMTASVAALTTGVSNAWRQMTLTKNVCDFSTLTAPSFSQGQTATIFMAFTTPRANAVTVLPGQQWFINVRNQLPFGGKSCTLPDCGFAFRLYPPS